MRFAYKYRLYPTKAQIKFLDGELKEACSLYNAALEERIGAWKTHRKSINYYDQANQLKAMRDDGCLRLTNFCCCQDVLRRLDKTFKAFFSRQSRGASPGFPRFKSSRRFDSITFPSYGNGCRLLPNGRLRVQGAGHIKLKLHRAVEGTIKTVTLKREASRWFACISIEREPKPLPGSNQCIGIDVGLSNFATFSDGTVIKNPRYSQTAQPKLRIAQRRVSRRQRGSSRRRKAITLLQKAYSRVKNKRNDFHHRMSRNIVNRYGLIAVERLNMLGLVSGALAKHIRDAAWSRFFSFIAYKAEDADRRFVQVDPRKTSQECTCGASVPKSLSDRWHFCNACGLSAPRDLVSAEVILSRAGNRPSGANVEVVNSCVSREDVWW